MSNRTYYVLVVLVLLLAGALRTWELSIFPIGLHDGEITAIRLQEAIRQGRIEVYYDLEDTATEGMYHAILALSTAVTGKGIIGYRVLSLWVGMLSLAIVYQLGKRLFGNPTGLLALLFLSILMFPILLSRQVLPLAFIPLIVGLIILSVAHAIRMSQRISPNRTFWSASVGVIAGISLYIHPATILVLLASILFMVFYALRVRHQTTLKRRRIGYTVFGTIVAIIVALPYLLSSLRRPDVAGYSRLFGEPESILASIANGVIGIFFQGDTSPIYNLPNRPLVDPISGIMIVLGIAICIQNRRKPRFALLLIYSSILLLPTLLAQNAPNFATYAPLLPLLALFFGIGIRTLFDHLQYQRVANAGIVLFFVFFFFWNANDLFQSWAVDETVKTAYHGELGQLAHHLDRTAGTTATMVCDQNRELEGPQVQLNNTQLIVDIMMNRRDAPLRFGDCRSALIFANGGLEEQVILTEANLLETMHPHLRDWLFQGEILEHESLPQNSVIKLNVEFPLADALGKFLTLAPVRFLSEDSSELGAPVFPEIRFGGNITLLGYDRPETVVYRVGDMVPVITYWRVEGIVPPDLTIFTHMLRDPVTIAAQRDILSVEPRVLQDRDVFIQVTFVPVPENMIEGEYLISIGAYQAESDDRLFVFEENETQHDQLFLYPIIIDATD